VERHGLLSVLVAADPDAVARLEARAAELTVGAGAGRGLVEYDTRVPHSGQASLVTGWWLVDAVWERLGLGRFYEAERKARGWGVDVGQAARLLVASRVVAPGSKKAAVEGAGMLLGGPGVGLADVYRALDGVAESSLRAQAHARAALPVSDVSLVFYDVTNYFFETEHGDEDPLGVSAPRGQASRERGYSKECRQTPIIQMGLLLGPEGLPLSFRLFDGNVGDVSTLPAVLAELKAVFRPGRVVVVADKALNVNPAAKTLAAGGDGWIFSGSARKAGHEARTWILDAAGWRWADQGRTVKLKSRIITRTLGRDPDGRPIVVAEKVICRWSQDYAVREAAIRDEMLAKARSLAARPDRWNASNRKGIKKYILNTAADGQPPRLAIDQEAVDTDAALDGYWLVHTSETTMPDDEILAHYKQLWRIEETFRVSKTDLEARPVYVRTRAHIEAHFTVCFLALLITRILEQWTGLTASQLHATLAATTARHAGKGVYLLDRPHAWNQIDTATGAPLNHEWATITQLRQWRKDLTQAAHNHI